MTPTRRRPPRLPLVARSLVALVLGATASAVASLATARAAGAQPRWREIGRTHIGNPVEVDRRSVKRGGDTVTATLRVRFLKPVKTPRGPVESSRTIVTFDCARRQVAVQENVFYHDERAGRVYQRTVVGRPGYAPPLGGTMPAVALPRLCER